MKKYVLEDKEYAYRNGKWFTSNNMTAPTSVVGKLNKLLIEDEDLETKTTEELKSIIDGSRSGENYSLAAKALEEGLRRAIVENNISVIRNFLPRLTSNYRKIGKPQMAIDISKEYIDRYQKQVWSSALFTSIAAAYCDLGDISTARKYANLARSLSAGINSPELINVYARIKSLEDDM